MATAIEAADLLTLQACGLKIAGKPVTKESAMAKYEASEVCVRVATKLSKSSAVMVTRRISRRKVLPRQQALHDWKGTSEIQKLVISRELLKD